MIDGIQSTKQSTGLYELYLMQHSLLQNVL